MRERLEWFSGVDGNGRYKSCLDTPPPINSILIEQLESFVGIEINGHCVAVLDSYTPLVEAQRRAVELFREWLEEQAEMAVAIIFPNGLGEIKSIAEALYNASQAIEDKGDETPITLTQDAPDGPVGVTLTACDDNDQKYAITVTPIDG